MAVQKKILFGESAYATIECAKRVDRLTNTSYDVAARKADERIEHNRFDKINAESLYLCGLSAFILS